MQKDLNTCIFDNKHYQKQKKRKNDFILFYRHNQLLLKRAGDDYLIPERGDFGICNESPLYLFSINSKPYFGLIYSDIFQTPFEYHDIFYLRNLVNKELAWIGSLGFQLMNWYNNNRYCGRCGSKTELNKEERSIFCPDCKLVQFPKISPAVIVAITCQNKILLIKGKNYKSKSFTHVAGYVDVGESFEETAKREVKEEVGLDIRNLRYFKSQPWPFSSSLMLGFTAEADENQQLVLEKDEIEEARWFDRDKLPDDLISATISGELLDAFGKGIF
jgi:NAD+ diphosphatase